MKCPLRKESKSFWLFKWRDEFRDCLEEECAWWDGLALQCSFRSIEVILTLISAYLNIIKDKMPHAEQFTK